MPSLETVLVTARLRQEDAQSVPISLSVVDAATLEVTRTNNIQDLSQLVPSLNYVSPNPRNTAFTIRGLGSSVLAIAQSNDGLEPGVGFYVDQVYHGRPATAAFDFVDLERVEVLRGPQGTLFGKNTTAGAINITSKAPSFVPGVTAEVSGGEHGYYQAKGFVTGALVDDVLAGRLSAATTGRSGVLEQRDHRWHGQQRAQLRVPRSAALHPRGRVPAAADWRLQLVRQPLLYPGVLHCRHDAEETRAAVSGPRRRCRLRAAQPRSL